jgi:hypothetical protein
VEFQPIENITTQESLKKNRADFDELGYKSIANGEGTKYDNI